MGNLDDVLKKHAQRHGIARQVEAVGMVERATEEIAKHVPKKDFEVVSFNRGILKVSTVSSATASAIRLMEAKILALDAGIVRINIRVS